MFRLLILPTITARYTVLVTDSRKTGQANRVHYGYRRQHVLLLREGWQINHKRVYCLYKEEGISLELKSKQKRTSQPRIPMPVPTAPNGVWSMDLMADRLSDGRQLRTTEKAAFNSQNCPVIGCRSKHQSPAI